MKLVGGVGDGNVDGDSVKTDLTEGYQTEPLGRKSLFRALAVSESIDDLLDYCQQ